MMMGTRWRGGGYLMMMGWEARPDEDGVGGWI